MDPGPHKEANFVPVPKSLLAWDTSALLTFCSLDSPKKAPRLPGHLPLISKGNKWPLPVSLLEEY